MYERFETPQDSREEQLRTLLPERSAIWQSFVRAAQISDITKQRLADILTRRQESALAPGINERDFIDFTIRDLQRAGSESIRVGENKTEIETLIDQLRLDIWSLHREIIQE